MLINNIKMSYVLINNINIQFQEKMLRVHLL